MWGLQGITSRSNPLCLYITIKSATNKELSLLTRKQELDIQELKRQLYLKELISDQSTELFPPKLLK